MKKLISLVVAVFLCLSSVSFAEGGLLIPPAPEVQKEITVLFGGEKLEFDSDPVIINGRTMVPMRKIFEELGATVGWDGDARRVEAVFDDGTHILLYIDNLVAYKNGEAKILETAPFIKDSRTFVPLRFVSEGSGAGVDWDGDTYTVTVTPPYLDCKFVPFGEFMTIPSPASASEMFTITDYVRDSSGAVVTYSIKEAGMENVIKYETYLETFGYERIYGQAHDAEKIFYNTPVVIKTEVIKSESYKINIYSDPEGNTIKKYLK